jgi:hypothetical protein
MEGRHFDTTEVIGGESQNAFKSIRSAVNGDYFEGEGGHWAQSWQQQSGILWMALCNSDF